MAYPEQLWLEAKKKCKLNAEDIRIAKEMGLNPRSLIKNIPTKQQQWKAPVHEWLRSMWEDRQEKSRQKQLRKQKTHDFVEDLGHEVLVSPTISLDEDSWFDFSNADESHEIGGSAVGTVDTCNPMVEELAKLGSRHLAEALWSLARESRSAQMVVERLTSDNEKKIALFKDNLHAITHPPKSGGISGHLILSMLKRTLELLDPQTMPAELGLELMEAFYRTDSFVFNLSTEPDSELDRAEVSRSAGSFPESVLGAQGDKPTTWDGECRDESYFKCISWDVDVFHLELQLLYEEAAFDMFVAFARNCTNHDFGVQVLNRLSADDRYGVRGKLILEATSLLPQPQKIRAWHETDNQKPSIQRLN